MQRRLNYPFFLLLFFIVVLSIFFFVDDSRLILPAFLERVRQFDSSFLGYLGGQYSSIYALFGPLRIKFIYILHNEKYLENIIKEHRVLPITYYLLSQSIEKYVRLCRQLQRFFISLRIQSKGTIVGNYNSWVDNRLVGLIRAQCRKIWDRFHG